MAAKNTNQSAPRRPADILRDLIGFDTSNPPGNEAACIEYARTLLSEAGYTPELLVRNKDRPNLLVRLEGQGTAPPLLLHGHVDVHPVDNAASQHWKYPPFGGLEADGSIWGRGALHMKGTVAAMLAAMVHARLSDMRPAGDVLLVLTSDGLGTGECGAGYLVREHADKFTDVRYALSQLDQGLLVVQKRRFYPMSVAEKQPCQVRLTLPNRAGNGTTPRHSTPMNHLARLLQQLEQGHLPVHVTPPVNQMLQTLAETLPFPLSQTFDQFRNPVLAAQLLRQTTAQGATLQPLLRNTVQIRSVRSDREAGIATLELNGSLLPGYSPADLQAELYHLLKQPMGVLEFEVVDFLGGPSAPDMGLFSVLADVVRGVDATITPLPVLRPTPGDARFFQTLGIQTYGWLPLRAGPESEGANNPSTSDERLSETALNTSISALAQVMQRLAG